MRLSSRKIYTKKRSRCMTTERIILDTNSLLASLSRRGFYYPVWKGFLMGMYTLCVSNEILEEYEEIIGDKTSPIVARNVIELLLNSKNVELIDPHFHLELIVADPDDNKFVDCAFASNASFIVSDDTHYNVLHDVSFPKIAVIKLREFLNQITRQM